jgi:hypothetical protein
MILIVTNHLYLRVGCHNQVRWREAGWLLLGPTNVEMWRRGGGVAAGNVVCFNVSIMGVEGRGRGGLLPEGEDEEASSSRR